MLFRSQLVDDEARRLIIDELVELDRPTFVIAGGETLLRKDFADVVGYAHSRGVPWAIHTHGGRVAQLLDVFERHPPAMVAVSLDGPRDYHDRFRGRPGCFDAALRARPAPHRSEPPDGPRSARLSACFPLEHRFGVDPRQPKRVEVMPATRSSCGSRFCHVPKLRSDRPLASGE